MSEKDKNQVKTTKKVPEQNKETEERQKKRLPWWALLLILLAAAAAVACAVAIPLTRHTHTYSETYTHDETDHWHKCTGCEDTKDKAAHTYDNDCDTDCNVCGKARTTTHTYDNDCDTTCNVCGATRTITHSYEYKNNDTTHWQECLVCDATTINNAENHTFVDGKCVCGLIEITQNLSYDFKGSYYEVKGIGTSTAKHIKIPATYDDGAGNGEHPVKSVSMTAFIENTDIISLIFSENMETIGGASFAGCTSLTSVTFSSTITKIDIGAFGSCPLLTEITLPNGLLEIGHIAFGMTGLKTISIPESVTTIGYNPFLGCADLTNISTGLNTKFHVTTGCLIDNENKKLITGLNYSNIPTDSAEVTTIGQYAFAGISGETTLKIPNNITVIEESIFESCAELTSVELPSALLIVDGYLFRGCENLTSIVIPASVTKIRENSFDGCTSLTIVYYGGANETAWNQINRIGSPDNNILENDVTVYYYSENEPTTTGSYWHYAANGVPTPW